MITSSSVSSDGLSTSSIFNRYTSEVNTLEDSDVWAGKSQENAVDQAEKFVNEFSEPLEQQFSDFSNAVNKYREWSNAKKNLESAESNLNSARQRMLSNPEIEIDLSPYKRQADDYRTQVVSLRREIEKYLQSVKSKKIDISSTSVKTPESYRLCDFVNFYQYNYHQSYGYGGTIASSGCGPTSMAMVLTYLTGETVDPVETSNWSLAHGGRCPGNGTYWSFFPKIAKAYGIECEQMGVSRNNIVQNLQQGKTAIILLGPGHFTSGGHYIVLRGLTNDGKVIVADPNSEKRSNQVWDVNVFLNEGRQIWTFDSDKTIDMTI